MLYICINIKYNIMKMCTKCLETKENEEFHISKVNKDNLNNWCKICKKEYDSHYRKSEKVISHYKSEEYKQKKIDYINKNYLERKINNIKSKIKFRNKDIEFSITKEDIEVVEYCPLLNIKLDYMVGTGRKNWNSVSIDRIDNSKGYIPGNVWIISKLANTMKNCASIEDLIIFSENSIKIFKNK